MPQTIQKKNTGLTSATTVDVALIGNPNAGKTTVFNALTGMRQKVGNYPGVTVEKKSGLLTGSNGRSIRLHDLPGMYSLVPTSMDEQIAADIVTGRSRDDGELRLVVIVVDASNLSRNLYLVTQAVELGLPVVVALNMLDSAEDKGIEVDAEILSKELDVPVIPIIANKGKGIQELRQAIAEHAYMPFEPNDRQGIPLESALKSAIAPVQAWLIRQTEMRETAAWYEAIRLVSADCTLDSWLSHQRPGASGAELRDLISRARRQLENARLPWQSLETRLRYAWIDQICRKSVRQIREEEVSLSEKADRILTHRIAGPAIFLIIFGAIFQTIFSWAEVPMEAIETFVGWVGVQVSGIMPDGVIRDLIVDGAIAGVGAILVFLPQIVFLFFFLSLLESTGYMARIAFIMDRFMRTSGLSGRAVIPLLSSFACAVPGIMATRTIRSTKERIITIMIAPLMSCSARLPVYALMIGAFIPSVMILGIFSLPGLTLLAMYLLGILAALFAAQVLKRFVGGNEPPSTFVMELPPYRKPSLKWTFFQMYERAKIFVTDAGKIILAMSIVLWFLASYPKPADETTTSAQAIKESYAGQVGHFIEPAIEPLGFDWKMGIGLVTSFAAREVLVSTLATIYNVEGADETSVTLRDRLKNERDPQTGAPVYTPLVAVSLMVFFVIACQCMTTVAIVKRETNSWRWPLTMVGYMTVLAYLVSLAVYQGGTLLGWG